MLSSSWLLESAPPLRVPVVIFHGEHSDCLVCGCSSWEDPPCDRRCISSACFEAQDQGQPLTREDCAPCLGPGIHGGDSGRGCYVAGAKRVGSEAWDVRATTELASRLCGAHGDHQGDFVG